MRSKNVIYSLISSFTYQTALTITNFVLIGLIIQNYGSTYNGLNSSVQNVINYLNIVEAGIALSAIYALYKPLANSQWNDINGILQTANRMYKKSGIIFALLLVIVAILYPFTLGSEIPYYTIFIFIIILGLSSIIEFFLNGKYRVLLMADQKSYIVNILQTISLLVSAIIKIILITNGYSFLLVMLVGSLLMLVRYFLSKLYIKHTYKDLNLKQTFDKIYILENKNSVILHQIAGLVVFNSPVVLVSIFVGLESASIYAIYNLIYNGIFMLVTLLTKSSVSSFGNLLIKESKDKIEKVFNTFQSLFFIIGFLLFAVTFILIEPFMHLYLNVDSVSYFDINLVVLFTIVGILNMIRLPHNLFIEAAGHYKQTRYRALTEAIINIIFSLIFINFFGIYGALMGSIASFIYRSFDIILYTSKNILKIRIYKSFSKIMINSLVTFIILYSYISYFKSPLKANSWLQWLYMSSLISIFLLIFYVIINTLINPCLVKDVKTTANAVLTTVRRSKK